MSDPLIVRDVLGNGLRLITEAMPHVRSISIGVWLTRGSRHERLEESGISHFIEHMLFKGTGTRSAEDLAQAIDSIGGQLDAFTAKEYASYYIKVLDEHLPIAIDLLSDIVLNPRFDPDDIEKEKRVILEEIKMVEDTPDDLVHELFTQNFWQDHALGRPILGTPDSVQSFTREQLLSYFRETYGAGSLIIAAAGNLQHEGLRGLVERAFDSLGTGGPPHIDGVPAIFPSFLTRQKDLEQAHVCLGTGSYPQDHSDRYGSYLLNTVLGGSMSSRLFQNIREKRGLAYAVFSGLSAYYDTGSLTVYAGCASEAIAEVVALILHEMRELKQEAIGREELRRAKDHLKGNLMLSLENTASRMSHLARQEIYFQKHFTLDETLEGVDRVEAEDVRRIACELFTDRTLSLAVLGNVNGFTPPRAEFTI